MATTQGINGTEIINNIDNYIVYLAKFAVEEHNGKEVDHDFSLILLYILFKISASFYCKKNMHF